MQQSQTREESRIGVYVCHCGLNIAGVVDCEDVAAYGRDTAGRGRIPPRRLPLLRAGPEPDQGGHPGATSQPDRCRLVFASLARADLQEVSLARPGLNPYLLEMANLREQCSWVHSHDPEGATQKAKDLVRSAVARARRLGAREELKVPVEPATLVIGGGVAGIQAALDLADSGYPVILVEKQPSIGGIMAQLDKTYPTMDCSI